MRKAFTMVELVFVIVIIGVLTTIGASKFNATRADAEVVKAKTTVANIRTAMSSEVQRRVLKADYTPIANLGGDSHSNDMPLFDFFDGLKANGRVLEYPPRSCKSGAYGCWMRTGSNKYTYTFPKHSGVDPADFTVSNNRFECDMTHNATGCRKLER